MKNVKHNYWTIIEEVEPKIYKDNTQTRRLRRVKCKCICGTIKIVLLDNINNNRSKSCGCYISLSNKNTHTTHGSTNTPLYGCYNNMMKRCYKCENKDYKNYGGRGIKVCKEWRGHPEAFIAWALSNGWKKGLQINRIDNNGNYEPKNCEFTTNELNAKNKRNTIYVEVKGVKMRLEEACKIHNISKEKVYQRISKGVDINKALTMPNRYGNNTILLYINRKAYTLGAAIKKFKVSKNLAYKRVKEGQDPKKVIEDLRKG